MTDELLPALPEPSLMTHLGNVGFTADQLHAYAREAIRQQWRPIDSAPKDGTIIIAWRFYPVAIMWTGDAVWAWEAVQLDGYSKLERNGFVDGDKSLTHWMPLPSPPAGEVA